MADRLLGVLGHEAFELGLGFLMIEEGAPSAAEHSGEFAPGIGAAHVDDPYGLDPRPQRLDAEEARGLARLDTAPELLFRGQQEVLVERIGRDGDLNPLA